MDKTKVREIFQMLAQSQGLYGRLLRDIAELTESEQDRFYEQFKDCKDAVDVIMLIEC